MSKHRPSHAACVIRIAWLSILASLCLGGHALAATMPSAGDRFANDGNYVAAVRAFTAAQQQAPRDASIATKLARANLLLGEHKPAVDGAQNVVALQPMRAESYLLLGDAYSYYVNDVGMLSKLGIAHKIRDAYRKAIEVEPSHAEAHFSLAMFYLMAPGVAGGSTDKAQEQLALLQKLNPAMAAIARSQVAIRAKDYAQAEKQLRQAISVAADSTAYVALGNLLASRERFDDALTVLRQATTTYPAEPDAWYQIGRLAADGKGDAQAGKQALDTYLGMRIDWQESAAPFCWAHYRLGQIEQRLGDASKAKAQYQQALQSKPGFKEATTALQQLAMP